MAEEVTIEFPVLTGGGDTMPNEGEAPMATQADGQVMNAVMSGMAAEAAAAAARRTASFDQLAIDSKSMWGIAMTSPTVMMGAGFRTMQQSGGYPADSGTGTGGIT